MAQWVPDTATFPNGPGQFRDFIINADINIYSQLFCPSARIIDADSGSKDEPNARTQPVTYSKGYKELTTLRVVGPSPWRRRRIVFSCKRLPVDLIFIDSSFSPSYYSLYNNVPGGGYVRQTALLGTTQVNALWTILFRGAAGRDWTSPFIAKIDTQLINVHSDVTTNLNPGNQAGAIRTLKQWYPTGKNMYYQDDENGVGPVLNGSFVSNAKQGMGDIYVYDIYQSITNDANSTMNINNEGTYYWHER